MGGGHCRGRGGPSMGVVLRSFCERLMMPPPTDSLCLCSPADTASSGVATLKASLATTDFVFADKWASKGRGQSMPKVCRLWSDIAFVRLCTSLCIFLYIGHYQSWPPWLHSQRQLTGPLDQVLSSPTSKSQANTEFAGRPQCVVHCPNNDGIANLYQIWSEKYLNASGGFGLSFHSITWRIFVKSNISPLHCTVSNFAISG